MPNIGSPAQNADQVRSIPLAIDRQFGFSQTQLSDPSFLAGVFSLWKVSDNNVSPLAKLFAYYVNIDIGSNESLAPRNEKRLTI